MASPISIIILSTIRLCGPNKYLYLYLYQETYYTHLISPQLTSPQLRALWLVAATANWAASQRTTQFAVPLRPITVQHSVKMKWRQSVEMRWGEVRWALQKASFISRTNCTELNWTRSDGHSPCVYRHSPLSTQTGKWKMHSFSNSSEN